MKSAQHTTGMPQGLRTSRPDSASSPLRRALERARQCLLAQQKPDGHWVGELQGDTILESEYLLLLGWLGREEEETSRKIAEYVLRQQQADGGWSNHPGGPLEVSVSVKAYFALKLTGHDPDAPYMKKAREAIRAAGGAIRCNSFTRFYLALLGQLPYSACPTVPPEMTLLPTWFYFNLYAMSSWTRTIVVPLTIFSAYRPVRRLPTEKGIAELFLTPPDRHERPGEFKKPWVSWSNFFLVLDLTLKRFERWGLGWVRRTGPPQGRRLDARTLPGQRRPRCHLSADDLYGNCPALPGRVCRPSRNEVGPQAAGRPHDRGGRSYPAAAVPLAGVGHRPGPEPPGPDRPRPRHPAFDRAVKWLLAKEVRQKGDWSVTNPRLEPGGWFFEYRNAFYPDVDDTAMVLMAIARAGRATDAECRPAVERGLRWLLAMQNSDGGWAAFDRDINREVLTRVPFADHNAMLDPSCPDITARVLEALALYGYGQENPQARKAIAFLRRTQESNGCWPGRWGVNYVYGTWQVLQGLQAIGFNVQDPMVRRAVDWIKQVQQSERRLGRELPQLRRSRLGRQGRTDRFADRLGVAGPAVGRRGRQRRRPGRSRLPDPDAAA